MKFENDYIYECNKCGRMFVMTYYSDGSIAFMKPADRRTCNCNKGIHPMTGSPTLRGWINLIKKAA